PELLTLYCSDMAFDNSITRPEKTRRNALLIRSASSCGRFRKGEGAHNSDVINEQHVTGEYSG
ncbi:MAG: hypothetical protein RXR20_36325, partial [Paraburkholderia sp.]